MLIFLDTEYTDLESHRLISLGMVTEDGRRMLYVECAGVPRAMCSRFVVAHVWPHLGRDRMAIADPPALQHRLGDWLASLPRDVQLACDSSIDVELLRSALGTPLPPNIDTVRYDLRPLIDAATYNRAVCRYHAAPNHPWHHALHDAHAHRWGWLAWQDEHRRRKMGSTANRDFSANNDKGRTINATFKETKR